MTECSPCSLIRGFSPSWSKLSLQILDKLAIDTCDDLKLALFAILTSLLGGGVKEREEEDSISMPNTDRNDVSHAPPYRAPSSQGGPTIPLNQPRCTSRSLRGTAILALVLGLAVVFGIGLFAGWQFERMRGLTTGALPSGTTTAPTVPPAHNENRETAREAVVAKVRPAVVQITVAKQQGQGLGSGVIIDQRGYIVTNNHVVEGAHECHAKRASSPGGIENRRCHDTHCR